MGVVLALWQVVVDVVQFWHGVCSPQSHDVSLHDQRRTKFRADADGTLHRNFATGTTGRAPSNCGWTSCAMRKPLRSGRRPPCISTTC